MRTPRRTTAILVTGAVVLASAAYAIGTQAGGGSAVADDPRAGAPPNGPGEPFAGLADALGVDEDELRDALADFRGQHRTERRDTFAAALADALGKSTEEVERAFEESYEAERAAFAKRLAAALDLDQADVEAALERSWTTRSGTAVRDPATSSTTSPASWASVPTGSRTRYVRRGPAAATRSAEDAAPADRT